MEKFFIIATAIAITYVSIKFIEMRFILKENKPVKDIIRDTVLVYLSSVVGVFIFDQINPIKSLAKSVTGQATVNPAAFVDQPTF